MKACGLVVEYNPFHNGHLYHVEQAKKISQADCMIAVMSGSFLQRGEPAIIDKYHRTMAALQAGVDIVVELPYAYAVQSSHLFATGSVKTLHEIGVSSICFGSESGDADNFIKSYYRFNEQHDSFTTTLKNNLELGLSYPNASKKAYETIGLTSDTVDLGKPNNILGFSYVRAIKEQALPILPLTIERTKSGYHDEAVESTIASATSIRQEIDKNHLSAKVKSALPDASIEQLENYFHKTQQWHTWEQYFPLLHYRVMTMHPEELKEIQGVDEGLEYRIQRKAKQATSFYDWVAAIKTKRYTWTRIQRMFSHILTNTKKRDLNHIIDTHPIPYVRLLGINDTGQRYLNKAKHNMHVPLITSFQQHNSALMKMEEKATHAYYSVFPPSTKNMLWKREIEPLIRV